MTKTTIVVIAVLLIGYLFMRSSGGAKPEEIAANKKAGAEFMETNRAPERLAGSNWDRP